MNGIEAEQFRVAWEAAQPLDAIGLEEDFEGGVEGWQVRMDSDLVFETRTLWYPRDS